MKHVEVAARRYPTEVKEAAMQSLDLDYIRNNKLSWKAKVAAVLGIATFTLVRDAPRAPVLEHVAAALRVKLADIVIQESLGTNMIDCDG
eukprot:3965231-Pyramimonas_sp.AAC.1